jgi:hypothetical protein
MKRRQTVPGLILLSLLFFIMACGSSVEDVEIGETASQIQPRRVVPRGERMLSIDINEASSGNYDQAFSIALEVGSESVSLSLPWDLIETSPGEFQPDPNFLAIANLYYPANAIPLSLMIGPIDTNNIRVPADLTNIHFDDPVMIERFQMMLDYAFNQIPDTDLTILAIGNEIDAILLADPSACRAYETFFQQTAAYARARRPNLQVGTKVMLDGLLQDPFGCLQAINQHSDVILTTYYPLASDFTVLDPAIVHEKFDQITARYTDKPIFFMELGYPSSDQLNSAEEKQAEFIQETFQAWDTHADQIGLISFTWMHDISDAAVNDYIEYYGVDSRNFAEFLGTLGLRTFNGEDKPAFETLREEASVRGW